MPLGINFQQIFLHLFNFFILSMGLYILLYKPVKKFMDERIEHYADLDSQTKTNLQEAEDLRAKKEAEIAKIGEEIEKKRLESRIKIEEESHRQIEQAKDQARDIIQQARVSAKREREKILSEANSKVKDMALKATKNIFQDQVDVFDEFIEASNHETK